jgi:hypothetical protein
MSELSMLVRLSRMGWSLVACEGGREGLRVGGKEE